MVVKSNPPLIDDLTCIQVFQSMGSDILDYVNSEKDLGSMINKTLNFTEQANVLYNRAN